MLAIFGLIVFAVTHTGELDVKDVVGYARVILTTAAHDALVAKYSKESK